MLPEINLLPDYERHSSISYVLFIVGIIIGLILFITLAIFYFNFKGKLTSAEEEYAQLVQEKEILEQQIVTLEESHEETLEGAISFAEQFILPASPLVEELVLQLPNDSYLSSYEYSYGSVQITSQHENKGDVATYVDNLVTSELMKDVKLDRVETFGLIDMEDLEQENNYYEAIHSIQIDRTHLVEEVQNDE